MNTIATKWFALIVIVLFLGVALAPSINAQSNDYVTITSDICSYIGVNQEFKISREKADELVTIFDDLKKELESSSRTETTEEIFKRTICKIDDISLLPSGFTVQEIQELILNRNNKRTLGEIKSKNHYPMIADKDENENFYCYVAGNTTKTHFFTPFLFKLNRMWEVTSTPVAYFVIFWLTGYPHALLLGIATSWLLPFLAIVNIIIPIAWNHFNYVKKNYLRKINDIIIGTDQDNVPQGGKAIGWIYTDGVRGIINTTGSFYGQLGNIDISLYSDVAWEGYRGVSDYKGLRYLIDDQQYYIGNANEVHVKDHDPFGIS